MLSAFSEAWTSWKTAPGVALLAVLAFAVGIGSATAIFTVVNGVMLRPLPYPNGDRFVALTGGRTTEPGTSLTMSAPELRDYEQQTASFDAFGWFRVGRVRLTVAGEPQFVSGVAVTSALARQLGQPIIGQWSFSRSPTASRRRTILRTKNSARSVCNSCSARPLTSQPIRSARGLPPT
jgi:hypothetical protein